MKQWLGKILTLGALVAAAAAQNQPLAGPDSAGELVRRVVRNEETAGSTGPRFMYQLRTENARGVLTREMVETKDGMVARIVAFGDKPLPEEMRAKEAQRLQRLLEDRKEREQKLKRQKEDEARVVRMVRALPDAFLFEYDGSVPGVNGTQLLRLKFKPNPQFDPPTRELQVYQGMEGTMLIDPDWERLVRIDGKLFRDVNFGWGIIGHLDKGGRFEVVQAPIGNGVWRTTEMKLDFTGKLLLFKSLKIKTHDMASNFRPVPHDLSFADGVALLTRQNGEVAGTTASGSGLK